MKVGDKDSVRFMSHKEIIMRRNHRAELLFWSFCSLAIGFTFGVFIMAAVR